MTDKDRRTKTGPIAPANDNNPSGTVSDPAMKARMDELVFIFARMLGRQIAREEFERRLGQIDAANDNDPSNRSIPNREEPDE
ncbi:hypothetical protein J2D73_10465 [Acetobacter sacchari]|uniref:Uncharacterized protein n=1 Tax=Acetobacter sacchari TaxID=2661687 RepID=A0ABS3LWD5_9PROT|nr:hypothetical protein [Acetobacter sacchari]MBO1360216.1 hypothetical protein [Acetobacter sacchari]